MVRKLIYLSMMILILAASPIPVLAQTLATPEAAPQQPNAVMAPMAALTVDTAADENDGSCSDGDCSLRDAIAVASPGDTITLTGILTTGLPGGTILPNTAQIGSAMPEAVTANNASTADLSVLNAAPVLGFIPSQSVDELTLLEIAAAATDVNSDGLTFSLDAGAPDGAVIHPTSGLFTWTPDEDQGPEIYTITVHVTDGDLDDFQAFAITVNEVNLAPVAVGDAYSIAEDEVLIVANPGLLDNDSDADIPVQTLSAVLGTPPSQGSLTPDPEGGFTYTPPLNFNGEITFTYIVSDGALTDTGQVTITVNAVNDVPVVDAGEDVDTFEGDLVQFNGAYTDPGRAPQDVTLTWDFGDGITTTGTLEPSHAYEENGTFIVTLTVVGYAARDRGKRSPCPGAHRQPEHPRRRSADPHRGLQRSRCAGYTPRHDRLGRWLHRHH